MIAGDHRDQRDPAPPFKRSGARAELSAQDAEGQRPVATSRLDPEGQRSRSRAEGRLRTRSVAVAAHLDTVFPEGTDVQVKARGNRLIAPGVGDNSRSLRSCSAIIRALDNAKVQTTGDILFVGDVGEEGPGDLRGMKYLVQKRPATRIDIRMFVSIDGAGKRKRYRQRRARQPALSRAFLVDLGGHSYGAFGLVNPTYAMAKAIDRLVKDLRCRRHRERLTTSA